ncbi:NnrS family protein [Sulfurimonas sp. HSL-1716]|uniref:NnrS family protein n=1 Tax=Hydrocurvibacter sulfurireducens TaxID=3131937 RepID=UPI0031F77CBC
MKFQTIEEKKENYFLSQPHQPFFMLGVVNAIIMMLVFALDYKGVLSLQIDVLSFHVYSLVFIVFTNVFTGFLFTTFPRFCQTQVIDKSYYTRIFYANVSGSALFLIGSFTDGSVILAGMGILFAAQVFIILKLTAIYKNGQSSDKKDAFWILIAQYSGLLSHLLFILSLLGLQIQNFATNLSFYIYLIFLTFIVAQRMIPFFSHSYEPKSENLLKTVFVLLLLKTLFGSFDYTIAQITTDIVLALYLLREFISWKLPVFTSPAILWVLHLGLFWLPAALFISAIAHIAQLFLNTDFYFIGIHLLSLGFVTTILIGFGTRVTLGHSGQVPHADRFATNIFWFIQVIVLLRALYSLNIAFGWGAEFLFDISFTAWLILFLIWGTRYGRILVFGHKI